MIDKQTQKYKVTIELEYEEEVFDEDPDDVYELADLEREHKNLPALDSLYEVFFQDTANLTIEPVIGE